MCKDASEWVDELFEEYYDKRFDRTLLRAKLFEFILDCASFKRKLERGEFDYVFRHSDKGNVYSVEHMRSVNSEDGDNLIVQMSLWPMILKMSADGDCLVIAQEAVWTSAAEGAIEIGGAEVEFDANEFDDVDLDIGEVKFEGQTPGGDMDLWRELRLKKGWMHVYGRAISEMGWPACFDTAISRKNFDCKKVEKKTQKFY